MQGLSNIQIYLIAFAIGFFLLVLGFFLRKTLLKDLEIKSNAGKRINLESATQGSLLAEEGKVTPISQELIIFTISSSEGSPFNPEQLITLLKNLGGKFVEGFFLFSDESGKELFRVANAKKPGILDINTHTNVIVCATDLNRVINPVLSFDALTDIANTLTLKLDGVLCDSSRSPISKQMMIHLRSKAQSLSIDRKLSNSL